MHEFISLTEVAVFKNYSYHEIDSRYRGMVAVVECVDQQIKRIYDPIRESGLFSEMLKIDFDNINSVLKFVNEYGLPNTEDGTQPDELSPLYIASQERIPYMIHNLRSIVRNFKNEVSELKKAVDIWWSITESDSNSLTAIRREFEEKATKYGANEAVKEEWEEIKGKDELTIANEYLALILNFKDLGKDAFGTSVRKIVRKKAFNNLYEVAWWQLSQAIINEISLKQCKRCGEFYIPLHGHQIFCHPLPGRKRSTCENSYNQQLKRLRKKEASKH